LTLVDAAPQASRRMQPLPNEICPLCGGPNGCIPAAGGSFDMPCWCAGVTVDPAALARVPEDARGRACLCRACATGVHDEGEPR
jgi:hypothetical protein